MTRRLPIFNGYTVDVRLRQFRKVDKDYQMEFIDFKSPVSDELLAEYVETLDIRKPTHAKTIRQIMNLL